MRGRGGVEGGSGGGDRGAHALTLKQHNAMETNRLGGNGLRLLGGTTVGSLFGITLGGHLLLVCLLDV